MTQQLQIRNELEVIKKESAPISLKVSGLAVTDGQSYAMADALLDKLVDFRKAIKMRLSRIIDPLKEALKEAQSLQIEADGPLAAAELTLRGRMKEFKMVEARQARLEEERRQEEARVLREQAAKKVLSESKARTAPMRTRLQQEALDLEMKAAMVEAAPMAATIKAAGSTSRTVKVPRIVDARAALAGVLAGTIPLDVVDFDVTAIRAYYKGNPARVEAWPGILMEDDVVIVKR